MVAHYAATTYCKTYIMGAGMRKLRSLRASARLFTSIALTSVTLGAQLWPASAAEPVTTVKLNPRTCVCHPGYPCICPHIAKDGTTVNILVSKQQLRNLSK
jgi:hypothetical protein